MLADRRPPPAPAPAASCTPGATPGPAMSERRRPGPRPPRGDAAVARRERARRAGRPRRAVARGRAGASVPGMAEPVYRPVIALARPVFRGLGIRFDDHRHRARPAHRRRGHGDQPHRLPRLHLRRARRPPDRAARPLHGQEGGLRPPGQRAADARDAAHPGRPDGRRADSYHAAVAAPRAGEIVGVFPEATISESLRAQGRSRPARCGWPGGRRPAAAVRRLGQPAGLHQGPAKGPHPRHAVRIVVGAPLRPDPALDAGRGDRRPQGAACRCCSSEARATYPGGPRDARRHLVGPGVARRHRPHARGGEAAGAARRAEAGRPPGRPRRRRGRSPPPS